MSIQIIESSPASSPEWCSLFNSFEFYKLHKTESSWYLSFFDGTKLLGVCHLTGISPGVYKSPYRGTYGGIDFLPDLDLSIKKECVDTLDVFCSEKGIKQLSFLCAPFSHHLHNSAALLNIFLNKGYTVSGHEINHTLQVDVTPLVEKMMRNNKKRFKKCEREGYQFEQVETPEEFEKVYSIIETNRKAKGFFISMSFQQIMQMYAIFPKDLFFFKVKDSMNDVASSICMQVNASVLYVFYWGDLPGYEQYSPIAYLANGIYEFAQKNGFSLIDAGTSSIDGIPNFGVTTFKENLAFTASPKLTYTKLFL